MAGISRGRLGRASWIVVAALACGGRATSPGQGKPEPQPVRVVVLAQAMLLEASGPPVADTSVSFTTGQPRTIVLRHGPPENLVFAELVFPPTAFADSGRTVQVELKPRPGLYGLDLRVSLPLKGRANLVFKYGRYFLAPAKARAIYGGDVAFERALSVGQLLPEGQLALLPSTRPAADNLRAAISAGGTYFVAAAQ
ncbi:MAG TPA: hypothetical protein VIG08_15330 [Gemmatimonadales bacterium]|jgi:hypothetical protein